MASRKVESTDELFAAHVSSEDNEVIEVLILQENHSASHLLVVRTIFRYLQFIDFADFFMILALLVRILCNLKYEARNEQYWM